MWITPNQLYNTVEQVKDYVDTKDTGGGGTADPALEQKVNKNTADIAVLQSTTGANTTAINKNASDIATNASAISQNQTAIETVESDLATTNLKVGSNTTDIGTLKVRTNVIEGVANEASTTATKASEDVATLTGTIEPIQTDVATLKTDVNQAQANITTLTEQVSTATENVTTLSEEVETAQTDISTNTTDITNLKTTTEAHNTAIEGNTTSINDLTAQVGTIDTKATEAQTDATMAVNKATEVNTSLGETNTTVAGLSEDVTTLETTTGSLQTRVNDLETLVEQLSAKGSFTQEVIWTGNYTGSTAQSIAGNVRDYDYIYIEGLWGEVEGTTHPQWNTLEKIDSTASNLDVVLSNTTIEAPAASSPVVWNNRYIKLSFNLEENTFNTVENMSIDGTINTLNSVNRITGWKLNGNSGSGGSGTGSGIKEVTLFSGTADTLNDTYDLTDDISKYDYVYVKGNINSNPTTAIPCTNIFKISDLVTNSVYNGVLQVNTAAYLQNTFITKRTALQLVDTTSFKVISIENSSDDNIPIVVEEIIGWKFTSGSGSGSGSSEVNYSLEEQKIGTWIDGKPLYQKTYELGAPTRAGGTTQPYANYSISLSIDVDIISNISGVLGFWNTQNANTATQIHYRPLSMTQPFNTNLTQVVYPQFTRTRQSDGTWNLIFTEYGTSDILNSSDTPILYNHGWVTIQYTKTTDTAPTA